MNFGHWAPITSGFSFDLLPNDAGSFWTPEADAAGVLESGDHSIQVYYPESSNSSQETSSQFSRRNSYWIQEYEVPINEDVVGDEESWNPKSMSRPCYPVQTTRDTTMNRIQRRRIQNRNSQRMYRQRRVEERHKFEARALAAEKTSNELRVHLGEMHAIVSALKHKVEQLEAENDALRRCSHYGL